MGNKVIIDQFPEQPFEHGRVPMTPADLRGFARNKGVSDNIERQPPGHHKPTRARKGPCMVRYCLFQQRSGQHRGERAQHPLCQRRDAVGKDVVGRPPPCLGQDGGCIVGQCAAHCPMQPRGWPFRRQPMVGWHRIKPRRHQPRAQARFPHIEHRNKLQHGIRPDQGCTLRILRRPPFVRVHRRRPRSRRRWAGGNRRCGPRHCALPCGPCSVP